MHDVQAALQIENADLLRHQLAVLQRQARGRPSVAAVVDPGCSGRGSVTCGPDGGEKRTRHRQARYRSRRVVIDEGFACYWRWKSTAAARPGRPRIPRFGHCQLNESGPE